mgnify:CR=1 FL=1
MLNHNHSSIEDFKKAREKISKEVLDFLKDFESYGYCKKHEGYHKHNLDECKFDNCCEEGKL